MKIYITGSSGFIGSSLINYLLNSQHSLILETSNNELVTNSKYKKPGVRVVNFGDNKNRLKYLSECDTVIHLAWSSSPSTRIDQYKDAILSRQHYSDPLLQYQRHLDRACWPNPGQP